MEGVQVYISPGVYVKPIDFTYFQYLDTPLLTSEGFIITVILATSSLLSKYYTLRSVLR